MAAMKKNIMEKMKIGKETQPLIFCNPRKEKAKVPVWRKLGFAVGSMPYTMTTTIMAYYLTFYLLEVALLDTTYVLIIVFMGRVWDAVTDPMCGYLSSRTRTKLGQFRPWLLFSAIPAGIVYFFLWYVPDFSFNSDKIYSFIYYLVLYLSVQTMLTCIHVPYTSLTMHLSYNQQQTDSVTLYRVVFELIGTLLSMILFTVSYAVFVGGGQDNCIDGNRERDVPKERAFRYHALAISVLIVIMIWITFFTVKEQTEVTDRKSNLSIFGALKETWRFRPYRDLFLIELFSWLAVQFAQGNFVFYARYTLKLGDNYPYMVALLLLFITLWLPIWQFLLTKIGKKTTFFCGAWIFMPTLLILLFLDYVPNLIWAVGLPIGMGVAALYLLPWSMLPDVVDLASLKTGIRREEFFYSFFVFGNKFSSGITLALSTGLYRVAGYDQESCEQPWTVPLLFKLLVTVPPIFFILISLIFLHRYQITETTRAEIKQKLLSRRKNEENNSEGDVVTPSVHSTSTTDIFEDTSDENTLSGGLKVEKV